METLKNTIQNPAICTTKRNEGPHSHDTCSLRAFDTMAIPLAIACALARITSASPDSKK